MSNDAAESATAGVPVVRGLEWRDLRPNAFPDMWCATSACGVYDIEEHSASDSPVYVALGPHYAFIANKDSLDEAKAAAQTDYEQRILSALNPDFLSELDIARAEIERLAKALADAVPMIEAVAHIGVDFGYGPYQVEEKFIQYSREFLDAIKARATLSPAVKEPK